jgi:phosphoglycerate-specific signal transduction histidine kinase
LQLKIAQPLRHQLITSTLLCVFASKVAQQVWNYLHTEQDSDSGITNASLSTQK